MKPVDGPAAVDPRQLQQLREDAARDRALVAQLQRDAVVQQGEIARLTALVERQQKTPVPTGSAVAGPLPWMAGAFAALSKWPKVATAVGAASIVATLGIVFTAFHFGVGGLGAPPDDRRLKGMEDLQAQVSVAVNRLEESEARASRLESELAAAKKALGAALAARDGVKDRISGLEIQLSGSRQELVRATAARDQAVGRATAQAQPRVQAKVEAPRMGYFDFPLREVRNVPYFTATEDIMQGAGSSWPTEDCTVVAISPLDGDDRPTSIVATCTPAGILINKMKGLKNGRIARVTWLLKP